jgi:flagellar biosynthesis anti-sigma factor FlgM
MTSRIDGNQGAPIPAQIERTDGARTSTRASQPPKPPAEDRVEVSSDAALLGAAVQAAHDAPATRQDKVEAARKALAEGTLGSDANALADALIERMLDDGQ